MKEKSVLPHDTVCDAYKPQTLIVQISVRLRNLGAPLARLQPLGRPDLVAGADLRGMLALFALALGAPRVIRCASGKGRRRRHSMQLCWPKPNGHGPLGGDGRSSGGERPRI